MPSNVPKHTAFLFLLAAAVLGGAPTLSFAQYARFQDGEFTTWIAQPGSTGPGTSCSTSGQTTAGGNPGQCWSASLSRTMAGSGFSCTPIVWSIPTDPSASFDLGTFGEVAHVRVKFDHIRGINFSSNAALWITPFVEQGGTRFTAAHGGTWVSAFSGWMEFEECLSESEFTVPAPDPMAGSTPDFRTGGPIVFGLQSILPSGSPLVVASVRIDNFVIEVFSPTGAPIMGCSPTQNSAGNRCRLTVSQGPASGDPVHVSPVGGPLVQGSGFAGLVFVSNAAVTPFPSGAGVVCLGSPAYRFGSAANGHLFTFNSDRVGSCVELETDGSFAPVPAMLAGDTWYYQAWYRDPVATTWNFSDAVGVTLH